MRNSFRLLLISLLLLAFIKENQAEKFKFGDYKSQESIKSISAGCIAPSGFRFLHVNNVRARINTGGDMFWDLAGTGQYYIPANTSQTSIFSSSLWIGGLDINNQLKLAALRYRQVGQDYWTGPLTIDGTATIDPETCSEWDRFFPVNKADVETFIRWFNSTNKTEEFPGYVIPTSILEYPAHGDVSKGQSYYMAPFRDVDGDGNYDPNMGDYPYYDFENELCPLNFVGDPNYVPAPTMESELYPNYFGGLLVDQVLKGDETLWWVFNDKGNVHTESGGSAIGVEIRAQAFGFSTNDEINNMSFYSYEIINRSTYELTQTYFSPWIDPDLGYAWDDFVGCDVLRGLGYCYNGRPVDEGGPEAYGAQPPAVGVDFFQGPYMDPDGYDNPSFRGDGLLGPSIDDCSIVSLDGLLVTLPYGLGDTASGVFRVRAEAINGVNFGNGIVDDERFGMRRFVYHNNTGGIQGDPSNAPQYYNYLRGFWKDNTRMLYGGNAHISSGALGPECDFMFPGDSDPCNWGTGGVPPNGGLNQDGNYWTEEQVGNNPYDRRFMQSAGPFTLKPGAVNYITVGIPWARAIAGGPWASVELLRIVDDKCQALFDNCFKVIDGPDAPDLTFQELDRQLIVYISNSKSSNNYKEAYKELDPQIRALTPDSLFGTDLAYDPYYKFEGYQIFQLANASITVAESRHDPNKVRLVAQFDVKNGVGQLVNYYFNQAIGGNVPVIESIDADNGIAHAFKITEDAFATGDRALVNHKHYYFSVMAYGWNEYKEYDQTDPSKLDGQKTPYLAGRKNIRLYTAIPHKPMNGVVLNSSFGDGPQITRIEGHGNGGMALELSKESVDELLSKPPAGVTSSGNIIEYGDPDYPILYQPVYKYGKGPVNIRVIDPLNVKPATYTLKFDTVFYWATYKDVTKTPGLIPGGDTVGMRAVAHYFLIDNETGIRYVSDTGTNVGYEQLFPELGISITFGQAFQPGPYKVGETFSVDANGATTTSAVDAIIADNNGLITSTVVYADSSRQWLSGVPDIDIAGTSINWIRSGTYEGDWQSETRPWDPNEAFEKIVGGTWAPYAMTATNDQDPFKAGPAFGIQSKTLSSRLKNLYSVEIVMTPDKSKWSRSPVLEMCPDPLLAEGGAYRFTLRRSASLDKDGNPSGWPNQSEGSFNPDNSNYVLPYGMSWFPGYAINLETGERMNIAFGEDSWLAGENGRDMKFNPTSTIYGLSPENPIFGGKHYVYILGSGDYSLPAIPQPFRFPAYDAGRTFAGHLAALDTLQPNVYDALYKVYGELIYACAMYVGIPLANPEFEWLSNEVKIRINISRPYDRYFRKEALPTANSKNNHYPMYEFSTEGIATSYFNAQKAESDLDHIRVVPNPYYAFAVGPGYERNPLDTRVKITNLPQRCVVTIYNVNGTLIRQYTKDDPITSIDWDLKNFAGIPIAGGVYMIHVKDHATGGERIVKWFGALRVEDFNQF